MGSVFRDFMDKYAKIKEQAEHTGQPVIVSSQGTHEMAGVTDLNVTRQPDGSFIVSKTGGLTPNEARAIRDLFPSASAQRGGIQYTPPGVEYFDGKDDMSWVSIDVEGSNRRKLEELAVVIDFMDAECKRTVGRPDHRSNVRKLKRLLGEKTQREQNMDLPHFTAPVGDIEGVYEVIRNRKKYEAEREEYERKIAERNQVTFYAEERIGLSVLRPDAFVTLRDAWNVELDKAILYGDGKDIADATREQVVEAIAQGFGVPRGIIDPKNAPELFDPDLYDEQGNPIPAKERIQIRADKMQRAEQVKRLLDQGLIHDREQFLKDMTND